MKMRRRGRLVLYRLLDSLFLPLDRKEIRRTRNIRLIPNADHRTGGRYSYAEWAHVIGIFQTLIFIHLQNKEGNKILDIGCGTGFLGIASEPFIGGGGKYTGIDVMKSKIDFCRSHYPASDFEFIHFDVANPYYAPAQERAKSKWPVESESYDLVTALSVWTHLDEEDALFYFKEISRVLKPNGKAIVTFYLLDDTYRNTLETRSDRRGRFHKRPQDDYIFDRPSYGSNMWLHPKRARVPEAAVGVTEAGLEHLLAGSEMKLIEQHQGNWKEVPGAFLQDVLIFQKA